MSLFYLYVALSVLLVTLLAMNVSRVRIREQIGNGDGGNSDLRRAIRAHMNSVEHSLPFALIVLALAMQNAADSLLVCMVFGFLGVRVLNGYAMLNSKFRVRQITAAFTYLMQVTGAVLVLVHL